LPESGNVRFLENVLSEVIELFPSPYITSAATKSEKEGWRQSAEAQAILEAEGLKDEMSCRAISCGTSNGPHVEARRMSAGTNPEGGPRRMRS